MDKHSGWLGHHCDFLVEMSNLRFHQGHPNNWMEGASKVGSCVVTMWSTEVISEAISIP
jgi:hypothetical protein